MLVFEVLSLVLLLNHGVNAENNVTNGSVISWEYGSIYFPENENLKYGLTIFSPTKPGNYSVAVFLVGLGNQINLQ